MRTLLASMNNAFYAGQRIGATRKGLAIDCPIDHTQIMLRLSWMDGFSKGRAHSLHGRRWIDLTERQ